MMWICILHESFLRRRLCLVVCMALAVVTLTESPLAKAQDIARGVNQTRNLELYYAAVTAVIPTAAVTSVLKEQFEIPHEDEETKKREQSDREDISRTSQTIKASVDSDDGLNSPSKVNERTNLDETEQSIVYSKDEEVSNTEATKERTNTHDHGKRTTNKSNSELITLDVTQQATELTQRTLPLEFMKTISGDPENLNTDNYIYDYYNEEIDDELDDDDEELVIGRIRRDTSNTMDGVTMESLQRLAEFATASNPDLSLINLITPNPDIEITIEVLPVVSGEDDASLNGVSANEVTHTKSPGRKGKGKKGKGKKKKGKDRTRTENNKKDNANSKENVPNIPSSEEEETNKPIDNEEEDSSYSYHIGGPLLPFIPDGFEDFNFPEDTYPIEEGGEWTDWSRCTSTCGGGRTERSRSCGFSCTATETQDCNQHSCPEIEYLDSQVVAGFQPILETSSPTVQTTDELFRYLDPSLSDFVTDSCEEWMSCKSETLMSYLSRLEDLPSCPCFYPTTLRVNDMLWDKIHRKMFRWTVSDNEKERLDVYKPSATYCIRSLLTAHSTSLAAQQCCYDETMRLITRGPGSGTPKLISREISLELNYKIDILPWIICKGDWSKYNTIRQPNNGRGCREFPADEIYTEYLEELNDF